MQTVLEHSSNDQAREVARPGSTRSSASTIVARLDAAGSTKVRTRNDEGPRTRRWRLALTDVCAEFTSSHCHFRSPRR